MSKYFIPYEERTNINYCFLFSLYLLAEKDTKQHLNSRITYFNLRDLQKRIYEKARYNISISTISRSLNNDEYNKYFKYDRDSKEILLCNNFKNCSNSKRFVILCDKEILSLLENGDNKMIRYFLYIKYYCGYSKSKEIDTTAKQILSALGYSYNSGNTVNDLCRYNKVLQDMGFIKI